MESLNESWNHEMPRRYKVQSWKFDTIWQSVVEINYGDEPVRICLSPCQTKKAALAQGKKWVENYEITGPESPEQLIGSMLRDWSDIFPYRISVLDHLFCVIGNGYEWLDGALISALQEKPLSQETKDRLRDNSLEQLTKRLEATGIEIPDSLRVKPPTPDTGGPYNFYQICGYSRICRIPADVRPEWLDLAKETANLIRTRASDPELIKLLPENL